ncbi:tRNA modification GTPase [Elusimicrobium simillimum]|uniref:tRNA uridine-5-carboxymethylaminomethyl(34) synthesis GTPase MnmE n=1 Tax=Elusimicrobium simillimum TaxID=3143438 RepID=UPI003C6F14B3
MENDTVCAVTTGAGGAVAMLRLSGPAAWSAVKTLAKRDFAPEPNRVYLLKLYDGGAVLDQTLVTFFQGPKSFTGEDVAEIACHGSPYIKGRLLEILQPLGVRPAKNGEFTMRAFLNGKMDITQAQGLCDLIAADNAMAHGAAMHSMEGKLSEKFKNIKNSLSELLAQIEVRLDDVDEEMTPLDPAYVNGILGEVTTSVKDLIDTFRTGKFIKDGIKVSIVGVPNAGKSSLLNAILGYDRAIVSEVSGTTRDTIEDAFDYKGHKIILTDTAGIRAHTLDAAEKQGMERSLLAAKKADIIIFTIDSSVRTNPDEIKFWDSINTLGKKIILACNKTDIAFHEPKLLGEYDTVKVSSTNGDGIEELKQAIVNAVDMGHVDLNSNIITSAVQYDMLVKTATEMEDALKTVASGIGMEFTAEHIRRALFHLKEIIGEVYADDILGIIFSKFCVGK